MNKPFDIPRLKFQAALPASKYNKAGGESKQRSKRTAATVFYSDFECYGGGFGKPEDETATGQMPDEPN